MKPLKRAFSIILFLNEMKVQRQTEGENKT